MYNKIFTKILDSSIWLESDATRIVWLTMLASMDQDGFCQFASIGNLAHRAIVSREAADAAVQVLQSPDKDSSDPEHEGRRIERVDGGWMVLNSSKYRDIVTAEESRRKTRERVQRLRLKRKVTPCNDSVTPANVPVMQSEAYAYADTKAKRTTPSRQKTPGPSAVKVSEGLADKRHSRVHGMVMEAYKEQNEGAECPWDGSEGKQLQSLLKSTPNWPDTQIAQCLINMYQSVGVARGRRPREFLTSLPKYLRGPLNEFNREIGNGQVSKSEQRSQRNDEKYARIVSKLSAGNGRNLPLGVNGSGNGNLHSGPQRLPDGGNNGNGKTIDAESNRGLVGHPKAT